MRNHAGNILNQINYEEHDGDLNAKKVSIANISVAVPVTFSGNITLDPGSKTAIVGNLTLSDPKGFIGLVTIGNTINSSFVGNVTLDPGSKTGIVGNLTLSDSKQFIGLVTVGGIGTITLSDPKGFIGLVTVVQSNSARTITGNVTLDPGSKTGLVGNVTLDAGSKTGLVGNVTIDSIANPIALKGNVTLDVGSLVGIRGNLTLTDSKAYIGLVTVGGIGTLTLSDPKGYIGLITVGGIGTLTLADPKGFIGLVTIGGIGTITLSDPKGFIGLVTIVPTYISGLGLYTSLSTVFSGSVAGLATMVIPPGGQKVFVRSMHVSSLGRSEMSSWAMNGSTSINRIPWTSLSTTSGFHDFFGENGRQWGEADQGLSIAWNGAATIGVMVDVRFV